MKRLLPALAWLLLIAPLVAFGWFVFMNSPDSQTVELDWIYGKGYRATVFEVLTRTFAGGVAIGIYASLLTYFAVVRTRDLTIQRLSHDNRRLGAANRALEAALPVLRERFDEAIGGLEPRAPLYTAPADEPEAQAVSVEQLALEDATSKQNRRRQRAASPGES